MSSHVAGAFYMIFFMFLLVFAFSFEYVSVADSDNQTSVTNSTRNAMTDAVNLGQARVNGKVTINEEIAVESVVRQYAENQDFYDGTRNVNIYQVSSDPAMIAVESYLSIDTPLQSMLSSFTDRERGTEVNGRSREIVIFEAKTQTRN